MFLFFLLLLLGVPYIFLVTKCDSLVQSASSSSSSSSSVPDEMFPIESLFTHSEVCSTVRQMAQTLGVQVGRMFPVKGYTDETVRSLQLEAPLMRAMGVAVKLAVEAYDEEESEQFLYHNVKSPQQEGLKQQQRQQQDEKELNSDNNISSHARFLAYAAAAAPLFSARKPL
jgi:hypothetical protein